MSKQPLTPQAPYSGLLGEIMKAFSGYGITPSVQVAQRELEIVLTKEDLKKVAFKDVNPAIAKYFDIEIHEGRVVIKVRLF